MSILLTVLEFAVAFSIILLFRVGLGFVEYEQEQWFYVSELFGATLLVAFIVGGFFGMPLLFSNKSNSFNNVIMSGESYKNPYDRDRKITRYAVFLFGSIISAVICIIGLNFF